MFWYGFAVGFLSAVIVAIFAITAAKGIAGNWHGDMKL